MKNNLILALLLLALFTACKKSDPTLSGELPKSDFTYTTSNSPGGDTLPFVTSVVFSNKSSDSFSWFWDFGDGKTSTEQEPVHIYSSASRFTIKLTCLGKGGNSSGTQSVSISSACVDNDFASLTGCAGRSWSISPVNDAIQYLQADGVTVISSKAAASCQTDDIYTFFADGKFNYDSKGGTFVGGSATTSGSCQASQPNATGYYFIPNKVGLPKIVMKNIDAGGSAFIAQTMAIQDNAYYVVSVSDKDLVVRGKLADGTYVQIKLINPFDISTIKLYLTGGSSRTWRLDSSAGAKAITVGIESNPSKWYDGGNPLSDCQKNDWYTFSMNDNISVDYNTDYLSPTQGYTCQSIVNYTHSYVFGSVTGSVAGIAQINLPAGDPKYWIGVSDIPTDHVFRILSIDNSKMLLRAGDGSGNVNDFKFVLK